VRAGFPNLLSTYSPLFLIQSLRRSWVPCFDQGSAAIQTKGEGTRGAYPSFTSREHTLTAPQAADLDRLMDLYQLWSHKMFPKTQFRDTVDRAERVCRQKRMLVSGSLCINVFPEFEAGTPRQMAG
jgi:hypothetical protein